MDFRHLIVTCLFSMLRLSFETQKIKENYAILNIIPAEVLAEPVRESVVDPVDSFTYLPSG